MNTVKTHDTALHKNDELLTEEENCNDLLGSEVENMTFKSSKYQDDAEEEGRRSHG